MKIVATEKEIVDAIIEEAFKDNSTNNLRENIKTAIRTLPTLKDELESFLDFQGSDIARFLSGEKLEGKLIDRYLAHSKQG